MHEQTDMKTCVTIVITSTKGLDCGLAEWIKIYLTFRVTFGSHANLFLIALRS